MKIRNGFVSNSSSSSFILMLDSVPTTKDGIKKLLFDSDDVVLVAHPFGDEAIVADDIVDIVHSDFETALQMSKHNAISALREELEDEISSYSRDTVVAILGRIGAENDGMEIMDQIEENEDAISDMYKAVAKEVGDKNYAEIAKVVEERTKKEKQAIRRLSDKLYNMMGDALPDGKYYIRVEYGDDNGTLESYLEHSDILSKHTFMKFSHH